MDALSWTLKVGEVPNGWETRCIWSDNVTVENGLHVGPPTTASKAVASLWVPFP